MLSRIHYGNVIEGILANKPLRILQVLRSPVGGLFRHVADLTRELAARGHDIGIVADSLSADSLTTERLDALRPFTTLGIHNTPMPRLLGVGDITAPLKIGRLADELDINVLHGHGAKGGLYARMARSRGRVALYTPHGGVLHFSPRSLSGRLFYAIERGLLSRTDAFIFESEFARRTYAEKIALPTGPAEVIHNGLDDAEFVPVPPAADARDFVFVGELRSLKGIFVLVESLVGVTSRDGRPATLVLAGDGPERQQLEARIAELGLTTRVTLAGAQPARKIFAEGKVAVVPSLAESLPYVVLEAAAAQLPVISTAVGGIPEIFGPTADKLLPAGDVPALTRAMQAAMDEPAAAKAEMERRLRHIREHFSVRRMTAEIEALYRRAISARRA